MALSRHTTLGTGGPARFFARPGTLAELDELLAWARGEGRRASRRSGSARTCSSHDDGVDALVLRLAASSPRRASRGRCSSRAAGRRTPSACTARATPGLGGFEFASAIPGTAGGGVRMNAGAYGQRLARGGRRRGRRRRRRRADGAGRTSSTSRTGTRGSRPAQVVAQVRFQLEPRPVDEIKAAVAELLAQRKATQPTTKRTFGSVFKNPPGERGRGRADRGVRAEGPPDRRRRRSRERHANFIENAGGATSADAVALMAEARRRVLRRARLRARARGAFPRPARAAAAVGERPPQRTGAGGTAPESDRADRGSARRGGAPRRSPLQPVPAVAALARGRLRAARARRRHVRPRAPDVDVRAARRDGRRRLAAAAGSRCGRRSRPSSAAASSRSAPPTSSGGSPRCRACSRCGRIAPSRTRCKLVVTPERAVLLLRQGKDGWVVSARGRVLRKVKNTHVSSLPRALGRQGRGRQGRTRCSRPRADARRRSSSRRSPGGSSRPASGPCGRRDKELTLVLRSGLELRLGDAGDLRLKLAVARRILLAVRAPRRRRDYIDVSVPERPVVGGLEHSSRR